MREPQNRVNDIDLLRFLAAMSVVLFHYGFMGYASGAIPGAGCPRLASFAKYGYLGVELFFIISGFVILMTAANGRLVDFVISRFVRLYPAFWICCTMTYLAWIIFGETGSIPSFGRYLVNMTMFSGFVGVPALDGAYWSLFVEMRFYGLVALVLLVGKIHRAQPILLAWLSCSVALVAFPQKLLQYLLIVDFSAFFIAGATFFLIWTHGLSRTRVLMLLLCWGLAVYQSLQLVRVFEQQYRTALDRHVVAGTITVFFLIMLLVSIRRTGHIGRRRWFLAGLLTYPLYLLHQKIGFLLCNAAHPAINAYLLVAMLIPSMCAAAYAVHALVERPVSPPLKRFLHRMSDRWRGGRDDRNRDGSVQG